jgi:hypothetical protein
MKAAQARPDFAPPRRAPKQAADETEGSVRLRATGVGAAELAIALDVSVVSARAYLAGRTRPNSERCVLIEKLYGVPRAAWSYLPGWTG